MWDQWRTGALLEASCNQIVLNTNRKLLGGARQDAPYLLEPLVEQWATQAIIVRLSLLTAATKLFFVRPAECQVVLGTVFAAAVSDGDQDVHDRGLMYYR